MPVVMMKSAIGLLGAVIIFMSSLSNFIPNEQIKVVSHHNTKSGTVFNLDAKKDKVVTIINNKDGKVKISFKNKKKEIEFDLEYSGELVPEDRVAVNEIMKSIHEHTKKDRTISQKIRTKIKDFVNNKL